MRWSGLAMMARASSASDKLLAAVEPSSTGSPAPACTAGVSQIIAYEMFEEAAEGDTPVIAGGGAVRAIDFDVVEEASDCVDIQIT